jgi:ABC-type lipoprotein release transport system permease subunit
MIGVLMSVGVMTVGEITVGVMTVGVMRQFRNAMLSFAPHD